MGNCKSECACTFDFEGIPIDNGEKQDVLMEMIARKREKRAALQSLRGAPTNMPETLQVQLGRHTVVALLTMQLADCNSSINAWRSFLEVESFLKVYIGFVPEEQIFL